MNKLKEAIDNSKKKLEAFSNPEDYELTKAVKDFMSENVQDSTDLKVLLNTCADWVDAEIENDTFPDAAGPLNDVKKHLEAAAKALELMGA